MRNQQSACVLDLCTDKHIMFFVRTLSSYLLLAPRTQTNIGKRAFSVAAPLITWNALPIYVRQSDSLAIFKSRLKTALFTTAFDSQDVRNLPKRLCTHPAQTSRRSRNTHCIVLYCIGRLVGLVYDLQQKLYNQQLNIRHFLSINYSFFNRSQSYTRQSMLFNMLFQNAPAERSVERIIVVWPSVYQLFCILRHCNS